MAKAESQKGPEDRHPLLEQLDQLWRNKTAVAGMAVVACFVIIAILAPLLSPHNPIETSLYDQLKPPVWYKTGTWNNILGTDDLGRDILSRIIYGARVSLLVAVVSVGIAFVSGSFLGAIAGFYKGFLDNIIMRAMDMILAFPHILLAVLGFNLFGDGLRDALDPRLRD